jgi:hypothetical protein
MASVRSTSAQVRSDVPRVGSERGAKMPKVVNVAVELHEAELMDVVACLPVHPHARKQGVVGAR